MKKFHAYTCTFIAGFSVIFTAGCSHGGGSDTTAPQSAPIPTVTVVTATRGEMTGDVEATGTLGPIPGREATIVPQVSGTLTSVDAQLGQPVTAGQVVAQISPALIQGQIEQAKATLSQNIVQVKQAQANYIQQKEQTQTSILQSQASVRSAQATLASDNATLTGDNAALKNAQATYTREQNLFTAGLVPQKDVGSAQLAVQTAQSQVDAQVQVVNAQAQTVDGQKQAVAAAKTSALSDEVKRSDIDVAQAQVSSAKGAIQALNTQQALYTIHAPISGNTTLIGASVGSTVDTTTKLITITDTRILQVLLAIPTADARTVQPGQTVTFTTEALPGKSFTCTVQSVSTQVDTNSGTVQALAHIANPAGVLRDDMAITARIVTQRREGVISVPTQAVMVDAGSVESSVDTVDSKDVLHVVPVKTGLRAGANVEILSGLNGGEKVAISGAFGLSDGTSVKLAESGSAN